MHVTVPSTGIVSVPFGPVVGSDTKREKNFSSAKNKNMQEVSTCRGCLALVQGMKNINFSKTSELRNDPDSRA